MNSVQLSPESLTTNINTIPKVPGAIPNTMPVVKGHELLGNALGISFAFVAIAGLAIWALNKSLTKSPE